MSSSTVSPRDRREHDPASRRDRPSLREIRLIGDVGGRLNSPAAFGREGRTLQWAGRSYRVAASQVPDPQDARRYAHLIAVGSASVGA